MELSKRALYRAQENLLIYKHEHRDQLPLAVLRNLVKVEKIADDPNLRSRHVIIAISGWLS